MVKDATGGIRSCFTNTSCFNKIKIQNCNTSDSLMNNFFKLINNCKLIIFWTSMPFRVDSNESMVNEHSLEVHVLDNHTKTCVLWLNVLLKLSMSHWQWLLVYHYFKWFVLFSGVRNNRTWSTEFWWLYATSLSVKLCFLCCRQTIGQVKN